VAIEKIGQDNMIVFKPKIAKYTFYFYRYRCGYCRKLHSEIDQYLAQALPFNTCFSPEQVKVQIPTTKPYRFGVPKTVRCFNSSEKRPK